jgi:hypothetical protein
VVVVFDASSKEQAVALMKNTQKNLEEKKP